MILIKNPLFLAGLDDGVVMDIIEERIPGFRRLVASHPYAGSGWDYKKASVCGYIRKSELKTKVYIYIYIYIHINLII